MFQKANEVVHKLRKTEKHKNRKTEKQKSRKTEAVC
jgi:hypothetical protein